MNKTAYIPIILILAANHCFAQNYIDYHKVINSAELQIVECDFQRSLNYYQKAFELVDRPFAKDLYNASLCATKLKYDSIAYVFIRKQLQKGIPRKFFHSKAFKSFRKSQCWQTIKEEEKALLETSKRHVNETLLSELEELERLDQKIRKRKYGYPMSDTIRKVDSLNMIRLVSLISEHGYPGENRIGVSNPVNSFDKPQNVVLRHFFQGQTLKEAQENALGDMLSAALRNGEISPVQYAIWEDLRYLTIHKKHKYGIPAVVLQNKKYRRNNLKNISEISENRKKVGLGTYDEYISKIIFQEKQNEFYFGISQGVIELRNH